MKNTGLIELEKRYKALAERYIKLAKTMTAKVNELRRNKNASADELEEFLADIENDSLKIDEIDREMDILWKAISEERLREYDDRS